MEQSVQCLIGLVSGVLSGMFGVGGGFTTTPLVRFFTDAPAMVAVATPLVAIIPTALVGAATHLRAKNVDVQTGLTIGAVGGCAAVIGAQATRFAGGTLVLAVTGVVLFASALEMFIRSRQPVDVGGAERVDSCELPSGSPPPSLAERVAVGLLAGVGSGFLGVGGGFILVPIFVGRFHFPMKRAIGTSLLSISLISVPGLVSHALLGNIDWALGLALALGAIPGGWIGARISLGTRESRLRRGFAVLMALSGLLLTATEFGWF